MLLAMVSLVFVYGCGSSSSSDDNGLLSYTEDVDVTLGSFDLAGGTGQGALAAAGTGNPVCGATSLDLLLDGVSAWVDLNDVFDTIEIEQIRYRITNNTTSVPISGSLQMEDPNNPGSLTTVASVTIPTATNVSWSELPFTSGGAAIVNHYLNNRSQSFQFCAEGSPDDASLAMTIEVQLNIDVTVSIL